MDDERPIGIIAAVEGEVRYLKKKVLAVEEGRIERTAFIRGRYKEKELVVGEAGVGISRASSFALEMVQRFSPKILISTGSCGAVKEDLSKGDIIIADEIILKRNGIAHFEDGEKEVFYPDRELKEKVYAALKGSSFPVYQGNILSTDRFIYQKNTKEKIRTIFDVIAVEMESGGVAKVAKKLNLPFIAVRIVSDVFSESLVRYNKLVDGNGKLNWRKAAPYFFSKPWESFWAIRFHHDLYRIYKKLWEVQEKMLEVI